MSEQQQTDQFGVLRKAADVLIRPLLLLVTRPTLWLTRIGKKAGLSPARLALLSGAIFVAATGVAFWQYRMPYAWHEPYSPRAAPWWLHPLEWNLEAGLPQITGSINAVANGSQGGCAWIAGDLGLFAFSSDQGMHWTSFTYEGDAFHAPDGSAPCGGTAQGPAQTPAATAGWWLVPSAYAANAAPGKNQKTRSSNTSSKKQDSTQQNAPSAPANAPRGKAEVSTKSDAGATKPQTLEARPAQLDFGVVRGGEGKSMELRLANLGTRPVATKLEPPRQPFAVSRDECSGRELRSGGECLISLSFLPPSAGRFTGSISFFNEYAGSPQTVTLYGIGQIAEASSGPGGKPVTKPRGETVPSGGTAGTATSTLSEIPDLWALSLGSNPSGGGTLLTNRGVTFRGGEGRKLWQATTVPASLGSISAGDKRVTFVRDPSGQNPTTVSIEGFSDLGADWNIRWDQPTQTLEILDRSVGKTEQRSFKPSGIDGQIIALSFLDKAHGWAITLKDRGSQILRTDNGGQNWTQRRSFAAEQLRSVSFRAGSDTGWIAGDRGVLLRTPDGGANWLPATQAAVQLIRFGTIDDSIVIGEYGRFIAPWYLLTVLLCVVLAMPVLAPTDDENPDTHAAVDNASTERREDRDGASSRPGDDNPEPSVIGNQAISDKPIEPGEPDVLGLSAIAAGLSFFLRNEKTKPPLAIAINGRWGSGKTSLMNLLKRNLQDLGAHPVWFNAWHHQKEDQMLAALLQAVKAQAVPPSWEWGGLLFHARLALTRFRRYWFRLLLLIVAVMLVYRVELFLEAQKLSIGSLVASLFGNADANSKADDNSLELLRGFLKTSPVVALLAAAGAIFRVLSRGLVAFGTNPASLLASVSGSTKIENLNAQTTFRQRFAAEFKDVTRALGQHNHRMLIVIDDLDRCRPERVREVLEGVNFLVSSGDCFVVLGMAREIVEHCVGLSFRQVVDTMSWEAMGLNQDDIARACSQAQRAAELTPRSARTKGKAGQPEPSLELLAKRLAFAHLYLDKLIQIEVSVPEPTPLQKRLLFQNEEERRKKENAQERRVERLVGLSRRLYGLAQPLVAMMLVAGVLAACWILVRPTVQDWAFAAAQRWSQKSPPKDGDKTSSGDGQSPSKELSPGAKSGEPSAPTAAPILSSAPKVAPKIEIRAEKQWQQDRRQAWLFPLILGGALSLVAGSLGRLPQRVVKDRAPFANALALWHPLVMTGGAKNTPRTARRFQNRVRYLAMRQRALRTGKPLALGELLLRALLRLPAPRLDPPVLLSECTPLPSEIEKEVAEIRSLFLNGQSGTTESWQVSATAEGMELTAKGHSPISREGLTGLVIGNVSIPEPILVAFAAIHEYEPDWIRDATFFQVLFQAGSLNLEQLGIDTQKLEALRGVQKGAGWNTWHNLEHFRRAYLQLCSEVNTGGNESAKAA